MVSADERNKKVKAYLLNTQGVVQIGTTVYDLRTGASFRADRRGLRMAPVYNVPDNSLASARQALQAFATEP